MGEEEGASIKLLSSRPESSRTQNGTQGDRRGGIARIHAHTKTPEDRKSREVFFVFLFYFTFFLTAASPEEKFFQSDRGGILGGKRDGKTCVFQLFLVDPAVWGFLTKGKISVRRWRDVCFVPG